MFLEIKDLTDEELYEKMNTINSRMRYMQQFGSAGGNKMYEQCILYMQQIELEMFERREQEETKDWESGTAAVIGEDSEEAKELNLSAQKVVESWRKPTK